MDGERAPVDLEHRTKLIRGPDHSASGGCSRCLCPPVPLCWLRHLRTELAPRSVLKMAVRFRAAGRFHWRRDSLVSDVPNSLRALSLSLKSPRSPILSDLLFAKRFRSSRLMRRWLVPVGEHEVAAGGAVADGRVRIGHGSERFQCGRWRGASSIPRIQTLQEINLKSLSRYSGRPGGGSKTHRFIASVISRLNRFSRAQAVGIESIAGNCQRWH
jgi:hypothetical protein